MANGFQLISHVTCSLKPLKVGTWTNSSRFQARNGFCHRCHWLCGSNPPPAIDCEGGRVNEFHTAFWLRLEAKRDGNCIVLFVALCEATGHNAWLANPAKKTSYIFSTALTNFSKTIARSAHNCLPLLRSK
jgi:hypothetical protein